MKDCPSHYQATSGLYRRKSAHPRAGYGSSRVGGRRSAIKPTDWHNIEKHRLAREVAGALERLLREHRIRALVIAAPPRTLSDLWEARRSEVKQRVTAELGKD
jgi:protein required for attachment to host cells